MELSTSELRGDSSLRRCRRMCLLALCTMLDTDSLEMGTGAAGSVSLDRAELMSLSSAEEPVHTCTSVNGGFTRTHIGSEEPVCHRD